MRQAVLCAVACLALVVVGPPDGASGRPPEAQSAAARPAPLGGVVYYTWQCDIWAIRPNGAHRHLVLDRSLCAGTPMVSPDGRRLLFRLTLDGVISRGLATYDLGTGVFHRIAGTRGASWVHWSPDGTRISYDRPAGGGNYKVWISRADGSGKRSLRTGFRTAYTAAWSANGTRMYFTTDAQEFASDALGCRYAPSAIYSIGLHGGHRRVERGAHRLDSYPSDAAAELVSVSVRLRHDTAPGPRCVPGRARQTVYYGAEPVIRRAWYATLSPDRMHLVFHDNRDNSMSIARLDGTHRRHIPNVPKFTYGSWGPPPPG